MNQEIYLGGRRIAADAPVFIVAEMSANHLQDYDRAIEIIHAAKEAGADAIKLQTYTADTMTVDSDADCFINKGGLWDGIKEYDLYKQAYTPWEWHAGLMEEAKKCGLLCFSSPFDATAVDFLEELDAPASVNPSGGEAPQARHLCHRHRTSRGHRARHERLP